MNIRTFPAISLFFLLPILYLGSYGNGKTHQHYCWVYETTPNERLLIEVHIGPRYPPDGLGSRCDTSLLVATA
ncbi:hypothetical protein F4774DRAFT_1324 [Daldinia eschscholtzii]|nr:hypothetical protein F4774DRAFT_1324 [Daldinia eschscholtzii]